MSQHRKNEHRYIVMARMNAKGMRRSSVDRWQLGGFEMTKEDGLGWFAGSMCVLPSLGFPLHFFLQHWRQLYKFLREVTREKEDACLPFFSVPLSRSNPSYTSFLVSSTSAIYPPLFFSLGKSTVTMVTVEAGLCILYSVCDKHSHYVYLQQCTREYAWTYVQHARIQCA